MRISMPRGDIHYIDFTVTAEEEFSNIDYTEIYFTVKRKYTDQQYLFQKRLSTGGITKIENNTYRIKINPEDTNDLAINKSGEWYDCDIEVEYENVIKSTTVGEFVLTREVTYSSNEG
ncbi:MAG: hypothetical protein J6Y78_16110 [Paludibacteraceae bacterium]|nr:hypothetical protein [Paludibacteraceae bacterium]